MPAEVSRVAVVGTGTMGTGIAVTFANVGIPVLLKARRPLSLARAIAVIRDRYRSSVSTGRLSADLAERAMALIVPTISYDQFDAVDVVIEAAHEDIDVKKTIFATIGRRTNSQCLLASTTSALSIDALSMTCKRPHQVIGHHFFAPPQATKALEIVKGRLTSSEAVSRSMRLAERLGKVGVVVNNSFGFVSTRMLAHYRAEACRLLEEGASVSQVDGALVAFGMPMGPFAMQDLTGIDVEARVRNSVESAGNVLTSWPRSELSARLFEMGRLGQKTGAGWYAYGADRRVPLHDPLVEQLVEQVARRKGIAQRAISEDEIVTRVMLALVNEGARILEEGIVKGAADIDTIHRDGFGYPKVRGGPMSYADGIGLVSVLEQMKACRARLGSHWRPAPLLERLAASGEGFYPPATPTLNK